MNETLTDRLIGRGGAIEWTYGKYKAYKIRKRIVAYIFSIITIIITIGFTGVNNYLDPSYFHQLV